MHKIGECNGVSIILSWILSAVPSKNFLGSVETLVARISYTMVKSGSAYVLFTGQCSICQSMLVFLISLFFFASEGIYRIRCLVVNSYTFFDVYTVINWNSMNNFK